MIGKYSKSSTTLNLVGAVNTTALIIALHVFISGFSSMVVAQTVEDSASVFEFVEAYQNTFNTHDPAALAAFFMEDADFLISGDIGPLDFRSQLKTLMMPVLILAGRFDRISIPRFSIKYKEYAPQAEFVMFEKSGHSMFVEEPEKTFKVITEFLQQ